MNKILLQLECPVCRGQFESNSLYLHMALHHDTSPESAIMLATSENLQAVFEEQIRCFQRKYVIDLASFGILVDAIVGRSTGNLNQALQCLTFIFMCVLIVSLFNC